MGEGKETLSVRTSERGGGETEKERGVEEVRDGEKEKEVE